MLPITAQGSYWPVAIATSGCSGMLTSLLLSESWLWATPGKSLKQTNIPLPSPSPEQHYPLLLSTGSVWMSSSHAYLSDVALCAEICLLPLPCWDEPIKSLTGRSFLSLFTTARLKAICLWSRVNTVIGVKPKVEQTLKTLMRFSCSGDKRNKVLCQAKWL